jgi:hypothetical protein
MTIKDDICNCPALSPHSHLSFLQVPAGSCRCPAILQNPHTGTPANQAPVVAHMELNPYLADSEQDIKQAGQRISAVLLSGPALEPRPIVPHVHIREALNEAHEIRYNSVQPVCFHLLPHKRREGARCRIDPPVKHIGCLGDIHLCSNSPP